MRLPPGRRPNPPPASLLRSLCTPRRLPTFVAISCVRSPPLCRSWPTPRSLSDPGGLPIAGPSAPLCPASLPVCYASSHSLLGIGSSGCPFCARTRGQGASTPWQLLVPVPLIFVHSGAVRLPSSLPPIPPPCSYLSHPRHQILWGVLLEGSRHHESSGCQRGLSVH